MKKEINVIRSNRKSISLEINPALEVTVRAPYRMTNQEIEEFVESKAGWLEKHLQKMQEKKLKQENKPEIRKYTMEEIQSLADKALILFPERVRYYAPIVGVNYGKITIRNQRTRWGSCSARGNLNFNCLLMETPQEVIDYVVVHELCHRLEMNHSVRFWAEVERVYPEYKAAKTWLKEHGGTIMERM